MLRRLTATERAWRQLAASEIAELAVDVREVPLHRLDRHHELARRSAGWSARRRPSAPPGARRRSARPSPRSAPCAAARRAGRAGGVPGPAAATAPGGPACSSAARSSASARSAASGAWVSSSSAGQVGVDLGREPLGRVAGQDGAGAEQVLDPVRSPASTAARVRSAPAMAYGDPPRPRRGRRARGPARRPRERCRCAGGPGRRRPARAAASDVGSSGGELRRPSAKCSTASSASPSAAADLALGLVCQRGREPGCRRGAAASSSPSAMASPGRRGPAGSRPARASRVASSTSGSGSDESGPWVDVQRQELLPAPSLEGAGANERDGAVERRDPRHA